VPDLGDPTSYLELETGVPVYTADGRKLGRVEQVLADDNADIFEGLVVATRPGPGGHRFVDATQIDRLYMRGVTLALDHAAAERLPEPGRRP